MKRNVLNIFIVLLLLVMLFVLTGCNSNNADEDTAKQLNYTYLVYNSMGELENKDIKSTRMIFTFDENNTCIDSRMVWDFSTEELAKENYEKWKEAGLANLKMETTEVSFNDKEQLNKTKDEIKDTKFGNFEITEY